MKMEQFQMIYSMFICSMNVLKYLTLKFIGQIVTIRHSMGSRTRSILQYVKFMTEQPAHRIILIPKRSKKTLSINSSRQNSERKTISKTISYISQKSSTMVDDSSDIQQIVSCDQLDKKPFGPVVMKLDSPDFHALFTPALKEVKELFDKCGFELCIAGGAVRDLVLGNEPNDIDFASTATPDQMIEVFQREGIRLINEGGHSHGTVTCRLHEQNFEITTLRIDKVTDGRHAKVEFTKDWYLDASRRDLTVNSMFLDLNGNVIDFFNGKNDLLNRVVKFVGDPKRRICEDFLRILRFFRFFGRIAGPDDDFDNEAITAIKSGAHGLAQISGERIWTEMSQILNGRQIEKIVRKMHECGIFPYIGLPEHVDLDLFGKIYNKTIHLNVNHMTYVSSLLENQEDVLKLEKRVQFSKNERRTALFIVEYRDKIDPSDPGRVKYCQDILVDMPPHEGNFRIYLLEVLKYIGDFETMMHIQDWNIPKFPVSGGMLMEAGVPKGKDVGVVRNIMKEKWKESNYLLSPKELLTFVPEILNSLKQNANT